MHTVFYHFAVRKLPKFLVQDRLEVCLALLGSLNRSRFGLSSAWLKVHSQLTGFNEMITSCLPKMTAKSKRKRLVQVMLIPLLNCYISVSDQDSELYPHFSTRIDIPEIETESSFHSGVNVS